MPGLAAVVALTPPSRLPATPLCDEKAAAPALPLRGRHRVRARSGRSDRLLWTARRPCALDRLRPPGVHRRSSRGPARSSPGRAPTSGADAQRRRGDDLLGHVPEPPRRDRRRLRPTLRSLSARRTRSSTSRSRRPRARPGDRVNELFGRCRRRLGRRPNARYRAERARSSADRSRRGAARPLLLVNSEPYTGGEPARGGAARGGGGHRARELLQRAGPTSRARSRQPDATPGAAHARLGRPHRDRHPAGAARRHARLPDPPGSGGREGLEPAVVVRGREAAGACREAQSPGASDSLRRSRGAGASSTAGRDPDKLGAGCVWLWARDPSLCSAGTLHERFDRDLGTGQIDLPAGVRCALGAAAITTNEIAALARVTRDADAALTILYARLVAAASARRSARASARAAERVIVQRRFAGRRDRISAAP